MISRLLTAAVLLAAFTAPASAQLSRDSKLLAPFKPIVAKASESTVRIKCDDKDCVLGTIVDANGYILTKLSELKGPVYVRFADGTEFEATTVAAHKDTDLALLKVDVKGLKPVTFADTRKIPQGAWVVASGATSDPVGVGIVSVMTRKLTGHDAIITNPNRGYLGIYPSDEKDKAGKLVGAKVADVAPGGAAEKAGMKAGDVIVEMNGKKIVSELTLRAFLDTVRGGDTVAVKAKRKGELKDFKVKLDSARAIAATSRTRWAAFSPPGGRVSRSSSRQTWLWTRRTAAAPWSISRGRFWASTLLARDVWKRGYYPARSSDTFCRN